MLVVNTQIFIGSIDKFYNMKTLQEKLKERNYATISIKDAIKKHMELMNEIRKMVRSVRDGVRPNAV